MSDDWHRVATRRTEEELRPPLVTYSQLENSPSRQDGISFVRENEMRRKCVALMQEAGIRLQLPHQAICTAVHYYHRFFTLCSMANHSLLLTAQTCLFIASKVEETSRRVRDILNTTYRLQNPEKKPLQVTQEYWNMKEDVVLHEQICLRVLGYNLTSRHPHHYVLHFLKDLDGTEELGILAWSLLNDSLRTTLCLQYAPESIACASIYLAAEMMNYQMGRDEEWWDKYKTNRREIEDICRQMLDLYDMPDSILSEKDINGSSYVELFSEKKLGIDAKSLRMPVATRSIKSQSSSIASSSPAPSPSLIPFSGPGKRIPLSSSRTRCIPVSSSRRVVSGAPATETAAEGTEGVSSAKQKLRSGGGQQPSTKTRPIAKRRRM